jgi:ecotin
LIFFNLIWHFYLVRLILFMPMRIDMFGYFFGELNVKGEKMVRGLIGTALTVLFLVLFSLPLFAAEHAQLKAFPPAGDGMERLVIELPHKERSEEENFKVELIPGKMMLTDGVNSVRLGVDIVSRPLKGWGYTFYEVSGNGAAMSTMIAVPGNSEKVNTFVRGASLMIGYNSRLPIVIYVPAGYEIKYRIWNGGTLQQAEKK